MTPVVGYAVDPVEAAPLRLAPPWRAPAGRTSSWRPWSRAGATTRAPTGSTGGSSSRWSGRFWATRTARAWGVPLRLVTFAPERPPMVPSETGLRAEALVSAQWAEQAGARLGEVVAGWAGPGPAPDTQVAAGPGWAGALAAGDWLPGDLLVVGSSRHGPLARVFLGSTATRIVRASPVPVVVVPRGSAGAHPG